MSWRPLFSPFVGFFLLFGLAQLSHSQPVQNLQQIRERVHESIRELYPDGPNQRIEIEVSRLDPRLRLAACQQPLTTEPTNKQLQGGRMSVRVRCDGGKPWSLFVTATIKLFTQVVVAAAPLPRGVQLTESDLIMEERNIANLNRGYVQDVKILTGMIVKRTLRSGDILTNSMVSPPKWIKRGDSVLVVAGNRKFQVKIAGTAMGDGVKGQQIAVRNERSKRIIRAKVVAPGQVEVAL